MSHAFGFAHPARETRDVENQTVPNGLSALIIDDVRHESVKCDP